MLQLLGRRAARHALLLRALAAADAAGAAAAAVAAPPAAAAAAALAGQLRAYAKKGGGGGAGKKGGGGGKVEGGAPAVAADAGGAAFSPADVEAAMAKAVERLLSELANVRTGRATPGMLDHLRVEAHGERLPLKALGSVGVRGPQQLVVTLFDPSTADAVAAAVAASPLGLAATAEAGEVAVRVPRPTADGMAALAKVCRAEGEAAKVSLRRARQAGMDAAKRLAAEDERRRAEKAVQAVTDRFAAEVDAAVEGKQKDIAAHNS
jgi:ribosome recycling factor